MSEAKIHVARFGGERTPKQAVVDMLDKLDDAELAVVVVLDKDGGIYTSWSDGPAIQQMGMLEFAKIRIMDVAIEKDMADSS